MENPIKNLEIIDVILYKCYNSMTNATEYNSIYSFALIIKSKT